MTVCTGFVKHVPSGRIFPVDRLGILLARSDMQTCDREGRPLDVAKPPEGDPSQPATNALVAALQQIDAMGSSELEAYAKAQKIRVPKDIEKLDEAKAVVKAAVQQRFDSRSATT